MSTHDDDTLANQIKKQLDDGLSALDQETMRRLKAARYQALEHYPTSWFRREFPAVGAALASLLIAVIVVTRWPDTPLDMDMASIQSSDIEMLTTLEIEELEDLDFYVWLEEHDGAV